MKLSIIIVNYNVRYFLEQCLHSVEKACQSTESEVFIVDNNSVDGSVEMVREKFPHVKLIANDANLGFSKANNMAIRLSAGEYVLLLNPDTLVEQDTFCRALSFMDEHPGAGALGVKMIDGKGRYLPESKRGLPTPAVAFYKIFGLAKLFPRSRTFGRYHLGYLDKDETHTVDILSGAFMLIRRAALDKAGLLDENFFMYGEDIDLSYRLTQAGYRNYYFPETRIIHYKGESTRKSSINYVFVFYNAMIIFARKHFSHKNARLFSLLIHLAIYIRAAMAVLSRVLNRLLLPVLDGMAIAGGMLLITAAWEHYIFPEGGHYPPELYKYALPSYILIWMFSVYMSGGYDKPVSLLRMAQGLVLGTLVILVLYSLLPERSRFSRALILYGLAWSLLAGLLIRLFLHYVLNIRSYRIGSRLYRRILIVGGGEEPLRVANLVRNNLMNPGFIGLVNMEGETRREEGFIGHLHQIREIIEIYRIDEVIFCAKDMPARQIMDSMSDLQDLQLDLKIAPPESLSIIGSKSISTPGDLYIVEIDSISKVGNRRNKYFMDLILSLILLGLSLLLVFIERKPFGFLLNCFLVLAGKKSWVGYCRNEHLSAQKLPALRNGVLNPTDVFPDKNLDPETIEKLNLLYARDYKLSNDLYIVWKGIRNLGNS